MITPASSKAPHPTEMQDLRSARSVLKPTEAPEGVTLLELDSGTGEPAKFKRLSQLGELANLISEKKMKEKTAEIAKMLIEKKEGLLKHPPEPEQKLDGQEAARVVELAKKRAKELGRGFPPPKNDSFGFIHDEWFYTVSGDGQVTRRKKDVLTPEQWEQTNKEVQRAKAFESSGIRQAEITALDKQIEALRAVVGPVSKEELSKLDLDPAFASHLSILV